MHASVAAVTCTWCGSLVMQECQTGSGANTTPHHSRIVDASQWFNLPRDRIEGGMWDDSPAMCLRRRMAAESDLRRRVA